jgi:hypothetical protein
MLKFANNARSTLRSAITAASSTLLLAIGEGDRFPALTPGDTFLATLQDADGRIEVVEVTARTTDQLEGVLRGRDDTSAKSFAAGTVVSMRVTAELLRRVSADTLRGAVDGVAPLDVNQRIPVDYLPLAAITQTSGDARYVRDSNVGTANHPPRLAPDGKLPTSVIPTSYLTATQGDARFQRLSTLGTPNNPAMLDATGRLPIAQLPTSLADPTAFAPKAAPQFTGAAVFGGTVNVAGATTLTTLATSGAATLASAAVTGLLAANGGIQINGGATRRKLTVSTSAPTGTPADGDEWYQYTA